MPFIGGVVALGRVAIFSRNWDKAFCERCSPEAYTASRNSERNGGGSGRGRDAMQERYRKRSTQAPLTPGLGGGGEDGEGLG